MIKNKHNFFVVQFFNWYIEKILKSDFHRINYNHDFAFDNDKSVLFICNHFSWWDGFFTLHLCIHFFKKKFNVMMLEEELQKRILFSYAGVYSIKRKSETVNESLDYTCEILSKPDNVVLIFPQGKIESMHLDNFKFEKGIKYVIDHADNFQLIYAGVFVDYFSRRKPIANIYMKKIDLKENTSIEELEKEYNISYKNWKKEQELLTR